MIGLALLTPDQAGNVGAILRLGACFGAPCHIIEPCGFAFSERALRRAGMDYVDQAEMVRHADWTGFAEAQKDADRRIILMTSKSDTGLYDFEFAQDDIILMGSESTGAPEHVHASVAARLRIPMQPAMRSLNIAIASGIALSEALRQTGNLPPITALRG